VETLQFFEFSKWPPPSWIFEIAKFYWLLGRRGSRRIQHAKLRQNRSIGCEDIKIWFFKDGGCRHLGLSNSQNFIGWHWPVGPDVPLYQILLKSVIPLRRRCNFGYFQDGRQCHLGFLKSQNVISYWGGEGRGASACQILSKLVNSCEDIKIFLFFKMVAVAILDFRNHVFLFANGIWKVQTHHCIKFCQNRSIRCGDIAIFRIFKMAPPTSWIFEIRNFIGYSGREGRGASACQILSKSVNRWRRY